MQFLLSTEEFNELGPKAQIEKMKDAALELAKRLANSNGFDCIRTPKRPRESCCYGCPAEDLCPFEYKVWPE